MIRAIRQRLRGARRAPEVPLTGLPPLHREAAEIDRWPTVAVAQLNELLPWNCFTTDTQGRRVGAPAWAGKRVDPQLIPDPRIVLLHELVDLTDRHVLEVGCFEGVHTIALCDLAASVTGVDSRVDNVLKTIVRTSLYGHSPDVRLLDVEAIRSAEEIPQCDVLHHCGVLYHLKDPVTHLREILGRTRDTVLLDTHYALDHEANSTIKIQGQTFHAKEFEESGLHVPFAGMYDLARWLRLDDLRSEVVRAGFSNIVHEELRSERNGARVLLIARRPARPSPEEASS
jgi:2-polyprenyl-3-methyl-5-hydroxy-6-metoxy-1,4-benzoquinol methylase